MFQEIAAVLGPLATNGIATSALPGAPVRPVPRRRPRRPAAGLTSSRAVSAPACLGSQPVVDQEVGCGGNGGVAGSAGRVRGGA